VSWEQRRDLDRREFLQIVAAAGALQLLGSFDVLGAAASDGWDQGQLIHLIPAATHDRFLLKASFQSAFDRPPRLRIRDRIVEGIQTDTDGRFWRFDAPSLEPGTSYELRLTDAGTAALCDPWPLKTMPAPDATPNHVRILAYTCAGGFDGPRFEGKTFFLDLIERRRLLARALSFRPDIVIANGDHIYWDIKTWLSKPWGTFMKETIWPMFGGAIDTSVPMLHPRNAKIFLAVCDQQIASLYGTTLRSTPAFFLTDDHDTFENDEDDSQLYTLPPDTYGTLGAEQTQHLYYPEFLPDVNRPLWLPGADKAGAPPGANLSFGTLRYGRLLEAVLYDCRRYVDQKGDHAKVIPQWVEDWVIDRTRAEDTRHFFQVPSLPFAYSSGKLGDWYPDLLDGKTGRLVLYEDKPGWQRGWFAQHQRLIEALGAQTKRPAVVIEGDFHASGAGKVTRSGELAFKRGVNIVLAGTMGTGDIPFPSAFRNVESKPSQLIGMDQALKPTEKNGFTIIDVTPEKLTFTMFMWRPPQPMTEIDTMKPALVYEVPRKG
jgi:hypothetical protein